jgi:putative heme-binding domain-containing protein
MPKPYLPPISLTPDQITSVILYLQSLGGTPDPSTIHLPPEIVRAAGPRGPGETWQPYLTGDSARGHDIFFDLRRPAACAKCHRVESQGGTAGPDLSSIGATSAPRSIVESLVQPGSHPPDGLTNQLSVTAFHDLLTFLETLQPYVAGDTARGRALFFDETGRAACAKCHRLGNRGGDAGPEITAVVAIRSSPFLLEAILKPSKHIASGYQTVQIRTNDNRTLQGVVVRETPDSVWLGTSDGGHVTVPLRAIVQRRALDASLMPDTLPKVLSPKDLGDLMAFLETLR